MPYWGTEPYRISVIGPIEPDLFDDWRLPTNRDMPVEITIDSDGGDVSAALGIAGLIEKHRGGCTAIVPANAVCYSAATIIFAAAHVRQAHVSARFLIHAIAQLPDDDRWTAAMHRGRAAQLDALTDGVLTMIARRCGRSVEALAAAMRETPISAMDAQNLGLVHDVEW